jgi:aminomethyltransferase
MARYPAAALPRPTPFHERTFALNASLLYKEWSGYWAPKRYDPYHEREYHALRQAATVMDATPLFKYEVRGADAGRLLARVMVRDFTKQKVGRVSYVCWCDGAGKVLDDGTVTRLDEDHYRVTSAEPSLAWLDRHARGLAVQVSDVTDHIAALALQGPRSRIVLEALLGASIVGLKFFGAQRARVDGIDLVVTRTGYTGDLGFELWVANAHALRLWDALFEAGAPHGIWPMGLDALDVSRGEAGVLLQGCDYTSARVALIERQKSTPGELGFGWMVELERAPFVGQAALSAEKAGGGPHRRLVGLEVEWQDVEAHFAAFGLPPHLPSETSREGVPVYLDGRQVGQATSRTWSPTLKRYLALATVRAAHAAPGTELELELTVEYERRRARARVHKPPFFDPERKRS